MTTKREVTDQISLYPLRFEPIYQYRLWGGRRLANLLTAPLPGDGPIGEAWLLSDCDGHPSRVAAGSLKGRSIGQLLQHRQGGRAAVARRVGSMFVPAAWCHQLVGNFAAGGA
jgi:hypothetical protein